MGVAPDQHVGVAAMGGGGEVHRRALDALRVAQQLHPGVRRDTVGRAVGAAAVGHHERAGGAHRQVLGERGQHTVDRAGLVEGGNDDQDGTRHAWDVSLSTG
jgi:hypothetical protein